MILLLLLQAAFGVALGIAMESVQSTPASDDGLRINLAPLVLGSASLVAYAYLAGWIIERWSLTDNQVIIGVVVAVVFTAISFWLSRSRRAGRR